MDNENPKPVAASERKLDRFDYAIKAIEKYSNGRKAVLWGISEEMSRRIKQKYGYIPDVAVMSKQVAATTGVKCFDEYAGQNDKYYIVNIAEKPSNGQICQLNKLGYSLNTDVWYGFPPPRIIRQKYYEDDYGNCIKNCPDNCEVMLVGLNASVEFGTNIYVQNSYKIRIGSYSKYFVKNNSLISGECLCYNNSVVEIGSDCILGPHSIYCGNNGLIEIGNGCTSPVLGLGSHYPLWIFCHDGYKIYMGDDCMMSVNVVIGSGSGHSIFDVTTGEKINDSKNRSPEKTSIYIGPHVWLGVGSCVLSGSKIGWGSIVGAKALVSGRFPNNCSIGGNPAKIIKKNVCWSRYGFDKFDDVSTPYRELTHECEE